MCQNMKKLFFLFLMIVISSCKQGANKKNKIIFDRIEYIYSLKSVVNDNTWKGFTNPKFSIPLIYYTDSSCYVVNPTGKFIELYTPLLVYANNKLKIYKTKLLDSISFHMATGITFGDSTSHYNYKSPFMNCSSVEITKKAIPGVNSTELWATMVIHECFHGFQYKHISYLNYIMNVIGKYPSDTLEKIYKANKWYQESIDKENDMLLAAIKSSNSLYTKKFIDTFFQLRNQRRLRTVKELNFNVKPLEEIYGTMEGTARYVEFSLYKDFATMPADNELAKLDTSYHSYQYFKHYKINEDQWLYLTAKTSYFYAIGFNMARLLDKLKIDYKRRLFNEGNLSLEQILLQSQKSK